jgi:hypothetical protein
MTIKITDEGGKKLTDKRMERRTGGKRRMERKTDRKMVTKTDRKKHFHKRQIYTRIERESIQEFPAKNSFATQLKFINSIS